MSNSFVKVFQSILDSTIWQEPLATKVVWITMLAMADREGVVFSSVPGLARRSGVTVEECEAALGRFQEPDEYSRTKENEGRRIEEVDGGWRLLNHAKYRAMLSLDERREYQRVKQAGYRERKKLKRGAPLAGEVTAVRAMEEGREGTADAIAAERAPVVAEPEPEEEPGEVVEEAEEAVADED